MKNFLYCTKLVSLSDEIAVNLEHFGCKIRKGTSYEKTGSRDRGCSNAGWL
ncbi:hypothetical protein PPE03_26830 [Pseudoalteromonas peptidolytica]|nr:hypothetical protein PPE03_26830 [Pseudoalteromonas peptidolytica]